MIEDIRKEFFSSIVVIVRGGSFPGHHLSFRLGLPIYYLKYDRSQNPAFIEWIGSPPPMGKLLLVEDLAGLGKTLIQSRLFIEEAGYEVKTFVIFKDALSASTPEFIGFETNQPNETFIVPWEKVKYHPHFSADMKPYTDHELEFTAWVFDSIFTADGEENVRGNALNGLESQKIATNSPKLKKNDVIITERAMNEHAEMISWLKHHHVHFPVFMRDEKVNKDIPFAIASWKGRKAIEIGCTRLVESDAEQCIYLANTFPHLEVIWWNKGYPISINASSFSF